MNYLKIYFQLISNAAGRAPCIIYDKHHIIPQSLGGPDIPTNWIYLTPREHLLAHHLLARAYPDVELLQSGFNVKKICFHNLDHYKWMIRLRDLTSEIEFSKNRKKLISQVKILIKAIGDADLDKMIPVKPQRVVPKPTPQEKPKTPTKRKRKKK